MAEQIDRAVEAYCNAWLASFAEANPYHTVSMEADDIAHITKGVQAALQSQQSAAPTREVVFGGPEVRARMLEAGLPTADDHAKLAAGRGGVSPPHQAAADPDLTSLWLLINAWQEAKPPAFELVGKINGEVLRLVAAPPDTQFNPDWSLLEVTQKSLTERTAVLKRALEALKSLTHSLELDDLLHDDQRAAFNASIAAIAEIEAMGVKV